MSRAVAWVMWVLLLGSFVVAPEAQTTMGEAVAMTFGASDATEPWMLTHLMLMGVWPMLFLGLLDEALSDTPFPAWPFVLGSMFLGCFALLPWFGLHVPPRRRPVEGLGAWLLGSRGWGALWGLVALGWFGVGAAMGSVCGWVDLYNTDGFVFVMTWDFVGFWGASVLEARRQAETRGGPWKATLVPMLGLAWYLMRRA